MPNLGGQEHSTTCDLHKKKTCSRSPSGCQRRRRCFPPYGAKWITSRSFTLIELIVMAATLLLLICILLPGLRRKKSEVCRNNLRSIGIAFRTWSLDSSDSYCTRVPIALGGSAEAVTSGVAFVHFLAMSNELQGKPQFLVCPLDSEKHAAKAFGFRFGNTNVSYFVGGDAADTLPQVLLSGDRNFAVSNTPVKPGLFTLTTNTPLAWTKAIHQSCGNILLADGSVQFYDSTELRAAVQNQGIDTNRLSIP